jgi:hypothetical protein
MAKCNPNNFPQAFSFFPVIQRRVIFRDYLQPPETKKPDCPKVTLTQVTHGSPAFLDTGSVTFCPHLTMGLAIYVVFSS